MMFIASNPVMAALRLVLVAPCCAKRLMPGPVALLAIRRGRRRFSPGWRVHGGFGGGDIHAPRRFHPVSRRESNLNGDDLVPLRVRALALWNGKQFSQATARIDILVRGGRVGHWGVHVLDHSCPLGGAFVGRGLPRRKSTVGGRQSRRAAKTGPQWRLNRGWPTKCLVGPLGADVGRQGHPRSFRMDNVIKKLTPEQALEVLLRLSDNGGAIQDAVLAEARNVLGEIDLDEIAGEVFYDLDSIDVHDCWDRAGSSRDGYTSPEEAAVGLIDEELQPFIEQARRYHELAMGKEEATCCMGVILGLYRYEHESTSEFRDWADRHAD
ncbi:MAG: hypothetical protein MZW92_60815 [Comamonadaceae bacterium]|nr:hypothetical protein [Comamonadaceae bacterium]